MPHRAGILSDLLEADLESAGYPVSDGESNSSITAVACNALRASLTKKYVGTDAVQQNRKCEEAALALFKANNEKCRAWTDQPASGSLGLALGEYKSLLWDFFNPCGEELLTFWGISREIGLGAGANVGHTNVDFYNKLFNSTLTTASPALHEYYVLAISDSPTWSIAERDRYRELGIRVVPGSVLQFVPKNAEIHRVICTEPPLEMLFQQGIRAILTLRADRFLGIRLSDQQFKNRRLARIGSIGGRICTVDLKSASDLNSRVMVNARLGSAARWLEVCRTTHTVLPDGSIEELYMMSSMGNAFTFPLQTILFTCMVLAVYKVMGIKPLSPRGDGCIGNYGVFGDDIACIGGAYPLLVELLTHEGHIVNEHKSYNTGRFRESCGHDYYDGHNVRGVYIQHLNDACDYYSAANRLTAWSARHKVLLPRLVSHLLNGAVEKSPVELQKHTRPLMRMLHCVPYHESDVAGYKVGLAEARAYMGKFLKRDKVHKAAWSYKKLYVKEFSVDMSTPESWEKQRKSATQRWLDLTDSFIGQGYEVLDAQKCAYKALNVKDKYLVKYARYFADALMVSITAGKLRNRSFVIREYGRRIGRKRAVSPGWDSPDAGSMPGKDGCPDYLQYAAVYLATYCGTAPL